MNYIVNITLTGIGATAFVDLWSLVRRQVFGIPLPDYGLVGRWIAYLPRGRFRHPRINATPGLPGELATGWIAHYTIGIAFAGILAAIPGVAWFAQPAPIPALLVGIGTVAAPFFVMQPGMGAGIAASRTPRPAAARLQSLITHALFGVGLYLGGLAAVLLLPGA